MKRSGILIVIAIMGLSVLVGIDKISAQEGFREDFSSNFLSPEWKVLHWSGQPWTYHIPHRYSLTDNPGHLRFYIGAMTNGGSQPIHHTYWWFPSIRLNRTFSGTDWTFETRVVYHLPFSNARHFYIGIRYGDAEKSLGMIEFRKTIDHTDYESPAQFFVNWSSHNKRNNLAIEPSVELRSSETSVYYFRITRREYDFIVSWSRDGFRWKNIVTTTMDSKIDTTDQTLFLAAGSWFTPAGSYADYDYIYVIPNDSLNRFTSQSRADITSQPIEFLTDDNPYGEKIGESSISGNQFAELHSQLKKYRLLIEETEAVTGELIHDEFKANFLQSRLWIYERIVEVLYSLHELFPAKSYDVEAFEYAERYKARAFLQLLTSAKISVPGDTTKEMLDMEQDIIQRLAEAQEKSLVKGISNEEIDKLGNMQRSIEDELGKLRDHMRKVKGIKRDVSPVCYSASEIQTKLLDDKTVLLEYFLAEKRSFLWLMTPSTIEMYALPPRKEIEHRAQFYLDLVSKDASVERYITIGALLYEQLLGPIKDKLVAGSRLIILPDGLLHYLPFGMLIRDKAKNDSRIIPFLVTTNQLAYAPSASVMGLTSEKAQYPSIDYEFEFVAFGNPKITPATRDAYALGLLPYSQTEVDRIGYMFSPDKCRLFLKDEATEKAAKDLNKIIAKRIHFAVHGIMNEEVPALSFLSLAAHKGEDGSLNMNEIFYMNLNTDLVVLSSCQSGRGKLFKGEGVRGLARAFMNAGAPSVVVSLWNVNDQSTAILMEDFYRNLILGKDKDEALRLAQLKLMGYKGGKYQHPFYWAPFVLLGNYKN